MALRHRGAVVAKPLITPDHIVFGSLDGSVRALIGRIEATVGKEQLWPSPRSFISLARTPSRPTSINCLTPAMRSLRCAISKKRRQAN